MAAKHPIALLESGPAGGVLSAVNTAREVGIDDLLALDMGGTTAKACVAVGGAADVAHRFEAARVKRFTRGSGLPILIPSIDLIEIGAGGGSIARVNRWAYSTSVRTAPVPSPVQHVMHKAARTRLSRMPISCWVFSMPMSSRWPNEAGHVTRQKRSGKTRDELELNVTRTAWGIHNLVNENMAARLVYTWLRKAWIRAALRLSPRVALVQFMQLRSPTSWGSKQCCAR